MYLLAIALVLIVLLWFLQGQRSGIRRHGQRMPFVQSIDLVNTA